MILNMIFTVAAVAAAAETAPLACTDEERRAARTAVAAACAAPTPPAFPGYAPGEIGRGRLASLARERDAFLRAADGYAACAVEAEPEAGVCAADWARAAAEETREAWGMTCLAYEDRTGRSFSEPCFPAP